MQTTFGILGAKVHDSNCLNYDFCVHKSTPSESNTIIKSYNTISVQFYLKKVNFKYSLKKLRSRFCIILEHLITFHKKSFLQETTHCTKNDRWAKKRQTLSPRFKSFGSGRSSLNPALRPNLRPNSDDSLCLVIDNGKTLGSTYGVRTK